MQLTMELFNLILPGEIFKVVTTKIQNIHQPMIAELTFVCKKGSSDFPSWAIYCHYSHRGIGFIENNGDKVFGEENIQSICPCDPDVLAIYRR